MKESLSLKISNIPANPGIYQFKDSKGKIIYVGKAKNLRNRVRSYFAARPLGPRIEKLVSLIRDVEIINTDSEAESLILEMNLIKKLKPRYNVNLKDDKSYPYIVITNEPYPRIFPTRRRRNDGSKYFGPYTDVSGMRYSLKMIRDIFKIRNCNLKITDEAIEKKKFKICLEYHIKKCEGPCEGLVSQLRYNEMVSEAAKVLNGKTATLIKDLAQKMDDAALNERFEGAAELRNKIQSLEVYESKQKIVSEDLLDKDIINFVKEQDDACVMILNIRDGKVVGKRHYYLDSVEDKSNDELLETVLFKHYSENTFIPDEVHLPEEAIDAEETDETGISAIEEWLNKISDNKIKLVIPKRGEKVQLLQMVKANAQYMLDELKLQRLKREFIPNSITALKRDLRLSKLPRRIECFDISHVQGTDTVASMVVFYDGKPRKNDYRKFKLETILNEVGKPDDFASMREVIYRRFKTLSPLPPSPHVEGEKAKEDLSFSSHPDLIVIDGGKGQLSSAVKVLDDIGIKNQNIIGLAKRLEEVFVPGHSEAQSIPKTSSGLKLLQRVRDEAHRFAITFHRQLRDKRILTSELEEIKGIGRATAAKLLKEFGSVENIKEQIKANFEEFKKKAGKKAAERLNDWFKENQ
jgi:excinuclease ABC subunit C